MKFRWDKKYLYWGITAFFVVCASICFYSLIFKGGNLKDGARQMISITMPIIDGLVLAYLMTPVLNFIEKRILFPLIRKTGWKITEKAKNWIRALAVSLTLIFVAVLAYAFFSMVIPQIFKSIQSIANQFPYYVDNLTHWLQQVLSDNPEVEKNITNIFNTYIPDIRNWINTTLLPQMNLLLKAISSYTFGALIAVWNLIIGLIISIYVLSSKEKFLGQSKKLIYAMMNLKHANRFIDDIRFVHKTFGGFISGKILDSFIIGILCFVCTSMIGTPYPMLISVIVGITNVVPFFGPYLGAIPSALLILMIDPKQCLYFLIFILILQQFDGNILGPKILGDSTGLSSFWVIFSITLFGGLFGIPGMIIGVPLFAVFYAMIKRKVNENLKKKHLSEATDEYKSLMYIDEQNSKFVLNKPRKQETLSGERGMLYDRSRRQLICGPGRQAVNPSLADLIGTTGLILPDELEGLNADAFQENNGRMYSPEDVVGKTGIEKKLEIYLQGKKGLRSIYTDELDRIVKMDTDMEPAPGYNIILSIDSIVSQKIRRILDQYISGSRQAACIICNNLTGKIIAACFRSAESSYTESVLDSLSASAFIMEVENMPCGSVAEEFHPLNHLAGGDWRTQECYDNRATIAVQVTVGYDADELADRIISNITENENELFGSILK